MSEEAGIEKMEKRIRQWQREFPRDEFVVRGHSKVYETQPGNKKVSSALYRQANTELAGGKAGHITPQKLLQKEREIVFSTRRRSLPLITDVEVLSDLQHFGCPTNCIDFTRDIYIALFFACSENESHGELIFRRHTEIPLTLPQDFKIPIEVSAVPDIEMVVPSTTDMDKNRPLFQQSVFVRHHEGCFDVPRDCVRTIAQKDKKHVRSILSRRNVSHFSLFNDTLGMINLSAGPVKGDWLDSTDVPVDDFSGESPHMMKKGVRDYCRGDYREAINSFNRAILGKPSDRGYRLRGSAHFCNGDYEKALEDIGNVSEELWNDRDYFLMALAYHGLRSFGLSLRAINNAIRFNPYRTIYHHFRIMLRKLVSKETSAQPAGLEYLDHFTEDRAVRRIASEKTINTEETYSG